LSTDDFLQELSRDMGPELARVYHALWHEVVWLHVKWKRYCQLHAPSSEHIPLLKRVASEFFGVLGFALWEMSSSMQHGSLIRLKRGKAREPIPI
jgi:hypothetical protein